MLVFNRGKNSGEVMKKPSNWEGIPVTNSIQMLHET